MSKQKDWNGDKGTKHKLSIIWWRSIPRPESLPSERWRTAARTIFWIEHCRNKILLPSRTRKRILWLNGWVGWGRRWGWWSYQPWVDNNCRVVVGNNISIYDWNAPHSIKDAFVFHSKTGRYSRRKHGTNPTADGIAEWLKNHLIFANMLDRDWFWIEPNRQRAEAQRSAIKQGNGWMEKCDHG